ncbi:MAG: hypothetical protein P3W94_005060 [Paracoccus sp. (in: a-proteobacteria)]|nr:hypothetical protein [Paracoccus sp. (in: a-proteobacteria)]
MALRAQPPGQILMIKQPSRTFRCPAASRATRIPSARSKASSRGTITAQLPADDHPRKFWFESKLEQRVFFLLAARPDTSDIQEQPPAITYTDKHGRARNHHFDFLLTQRTGLRLAIAVKSAGIVERRGFREELQLIRAATPLSFAKEVVLVTDRSFSRAEALNAERLHEFRRVPDPDADAAIAALLADLTTETTIASLVEASRLEGRGFRAAFRAIYAGLARPLAAGVIQPSTLISAGVAQ